MMQDSSTTNRATVPGESETVELDPKQEIMRLAGLDRFRYESERKEASKALNIRQNVLDEFVARQRAGDVGSKKLQGSQVLLHQHELWPDVVDGRELIDLIVTAIKKYVVLSEQEAIAIALWMLFAHAHDAFQVSPRLFISSPEKQCGKTTLLAVLNPLVPSPLSSSNATAATVFRVIELYGPTLLIDEADSFLGNRDDIRGVLNSGHSKSGAYILRTVGEDHEPRVFSTWAPVVIAGIGNIPDTLESRSIIIKLRRKLPNEKIQRLRLDRLEHLEEIGRKAARWMADNVASLRDCDPAVPDELGDRAQDNWRPLLSIASVIGVSCLNEASSAAIALVCANEVSDEQSQSVMFLNDCMQAFEERDADRLKSADLVQILNAREDRPWSESNNGRGLTAHAVSKHLKRFGIGSTKIRFDDQTVLQGYERIVFVDPYQRYVTDGKLGTARVAPAQKRNTGTKGTVLARNEPWQLEPGNGLFQLEKAQEPRKSGDSSDVPVSPFPFNPAPEMPEIPAFLDRRINNVGEPMHIMGRRGYAKI